MTIKPEGPKGKRLCEVLVEFSAKNLTGFGGLAAFGEFINRLGLAELLEGVNVPHVGRLYSTGRLLLVLLLGSVVGLDRISDVARLRADGVLLRVLGWTEWPVQSTLTRFLRRFTEEAVESLQEMMAAALDRFRNGWKDLPRLHLDLDSHVRTVHGKTLEGAHRGYNPNKKGRPSYHPLAAFIGETRDVLRGRFRPGNVRSANGAADFLHECIRQIGGQESIWDRLRWLIVRADSGFCEADFLQALETYGDRLKYVVALKMYKHHQRRFCELAFTGVWGSTSGVEIAAYISTDWPDKKARRIVVIREPLPDEGPQDVPGKQLKLFPELKGYAYRAFVTNSKAPAVEIWRDYNGRATCENVIKEAITFGLDVNATRKFFPNAAHFLLSLLAYNLLNWFKELALVGPSEPLKQMAKAVRQSILCVPARLVERGRQLRLKFPVDWAWRDKLEAACQRVLAWTAAGC